MRLPKLNALRMFDAAARHGNFRRAADELHLTQGAVAQQVRALEADLGRQLFLRKARGLELTRDGRTYARAVGRALSIIDEATRALSPPADTVILSVPPSFASKWLLPRLGAFEDANPHVDLQILATEDLADFRTDGVDLAVRLGTPPFGEGLDVRKLSATNLVAVAGRDYAQAHAPVREPADLAGHRLLQDAHGSWDDLFAKLSVGKPQRVSRFNQTALAIDAAIANRGVALVSLLLVESELADGRLVVLWRDPARSEAGYYAVHAGAEAPNAAARDAVGTWLVRQTRAD